MTRPRPLSRPQVTQYLQRIGIDGQPAASERWLERIHVAHLLHVPFENIDLHTDQPIRLEVPALFEKLIHRRRGGYCYELNGLFASLLATVGFDVSMVSSRVWMPDGELSAPFDHLALIVDLHDDRWLVDVGYGDAFLTPRPLGSQWTEPTRRLRTVETARGWQLEKSRDDHWTPMYLLDLTPRTLSEFVPRSRWHETSSASPFRRSIFASRATERGRVTITNDRLVVTDSGQRTEQQLPDNARHHTLHRLFPASIADAFEAAHAPRVTTERPSPPAVMREPPRKTRRA